MDSPDESLEDFNQRKSEYIKEKLGIIKQLQELQNKQDELILQLLKLNKPTKGPPEFWTLCQSSKEQVCRQLQGLLPGHCDYEIDHSKYQHISGFTAGRIVTKSGVKWTEPILSEDIEHVQRTQEEQNYQFQKILKPNYKSESDLEREACPGFRTPLRCFEDDDSW